MGTTRKIVYTIVSILTVLVAVGSLLSVFRDTDHRYLKMLDFPRIQFFLGAIVCLLLFVLLSRRWQWYDYLLVLGLIGGMLVNGRYLINYTSLVPVAVPTAEKLEPSDNRLSLLIANVKMSNREAEPLIELVREKQPDLLLAMEVDDWWDEQLQEVEKDYLYSQEAINEVSYGMMLYSKYPLEGVRTEYLQNEKVPSFESTIVLSSSKKITFHAVHPPPPTHFKHIPDNKGEKEVAMIKIGKKVQNRQFPTIVAGDINDVVWSHTDDLTHTENLLHDVRVGRGFYNSFDAHNILMRWPLDHVFVTEEFRLKAIERLPTIGSDHFPIYVELVL